jgi:hypothetical protein
LVFTKISLTYLKIRTYEEVKKDFKKGYVKPEVNGVNPNREMDDLLFSTEIDLKIQIFTLIKRKSLIEIKTNIKSILTASIC